MRKIKHETPYHVLLSIPPVITEPAYLISSLLPQPGDAPCHFNMGLNEDKSCTLSLMWIRKETECYYVRTALFTRDINSFQHERGGNCLSKGYCNV